MQRTFATVQLVFSSQVLGILILRGTPLGVLPTTAYARQLKTTCRVPLLRISADRDARSTAWQSTAKCQAGSKRRGAQGGTDMQAAAADEHSSRWVLAMACRQHQLAGTAAACMLAAAAHHHQGDAIVSQEAPQGLAANAPGAPRDHQQGGADDAKGDE